MNLKQNKGFKVGRKEFVLSTKVDKVLKFKIDYISDYEDMMSSQAVRKALKEYVNKWEAINLPIQIPEHP